MDLSFLLSIMIFAGILLVFLSLYIFIKAQGEKRLIVDKIEKSVGQAPLSVSIGDTAVGYTSSFKQFFIGLFTRFG
jgi:hypothetical protein